MPVAWTTVTVEMVRSRRTINMFCKWSQHGLENMWDMREWWEWSRHTGRDGLSGGVILEYHSIRASHAKSWGKSISERWNSQCKGPEVKTNGVCVNSPREQGDSGTGKGVKRNMNFVGFCPVCDGKPLEL